MNRRKRKKSGFTLMEVNIAVFVMATGILAMIMLFPLGMREGIQSQTAFKQTMFADYVLNVAVTAACNTNVTWSEWRTWADQYNTRGLGREDKLKIGLIDSVPEFIWSKNGASSLMSAVNRYGSQQTSGYQHTANTRNITWSIYCVLVPGFSDQVMGIMVRSLDMDTRKMDDNEKRRRLEQQPVFYAEARFQGQHDK